MFVLRLKIPDALLRWLAGACSVVQVGAMKYGRVFSESGVTSGESKTCGKFPFRSIVDRTSTLS